MHIPDGILPAQLCVAGYAIASPIAWYSLRQIKRQPDPTSGIPKASLLTAAFFVASSIHIPIPPASIHLMLNGMLGALLGYYAFPAILIGLVFQAILIGHGGLTTLGINALIMGAPALLAYLIFRLRYPLAMRLGNSVTNRIHSLLVRARLSQVSKPAENRLSVANGILAFLAGAIGPAGGILIFFVILITNIPAGFDPATERAAIYGLSLAHIPLALIEGAFTTMLVLFLQRVKPELLEWHGQARLQSKINIPEAHE
jgi:cobalt/nickel transport system permease protein